MPRTARILLPNFPHHIVQRGHNRKAIFFGNSDYEYYLDNLWQWKINLEIEVYAWCLMTNHVHLVVNPGPDEASISRLMKRLAGKQTRHVNKIQSRTGSLWEGRFKASPIQADAYLLQCSRYVELNPVQAGMVRRAEDYPWSSYRAKIGIVHTGLLDPDPCYLAMKHPEERYRKFVEQGVSSEEEQFLRQRVQQNALTGNDSFVDEIEQQTGLRIEYREPGRPRREEK